MNSLKGEGVAMEAWSCEISTVSLFLAFSPGKGSFTVIETLLPQALYTHIYYIHAHKKTHTHKLWPCQLCAWLAGAMCHVRFIFLLLYFCLCVCVSVLKHVCHTVCTQLQVCVCVRMCLSHCATVSSCLCESFQIFACACSAVLSGGTMSLKVHNGKIREKRWSQEMNEGVEMET